MSPGFLTGVLWILTDINRLLVLAALGGLVTSAVWAIRRRSRLPSGPSGIVKKGAAPLGVKITAVWAGLMAVSGFAAGGIYLVFHERFSASGPNGLIAGPIAITMGILLALVVVGLWKLKRWAWWAAVGIFALIFVPTCFQLLHRRLFPDPWHGWHFYLYLALLAYLLRPSIRRRFTDKS